jgi:NTE family protein
MQGILRVALAVSMLMMKAGIPIDIITGTSMGSIVGGLYAIGYDAQSLDSVARAQD